MVQDRIGALSFQSYWGGGGIDDFGIWDTAIDAKAVDRVFIFGVAAVPEPGTGLLLGLGLALLSRFPRALAETSARDATTSTISELRQVGAGP